MLRRHGRRELAEHALLFALDLGEAELEPIALLRRLARLDEQRAARRGRAEHDALDP